MLEQFLYELGELFDPNMIHVTPHKVVVTVFEHELTFAMEENLHYAVVLMNQYRSVFKWVTSNNETYAMTIGGVRLTFYFKPNPLLVLI